MPSIHQVGTLTAGRSRFLSAVSTRRVRGPTIEYLFDRAECLAGYARDTNDLELFGHLSIDTSTVKCKGLGVEARPGNVDDRSVISTSNSSRFEEEMDKGLGWTMEAWVIFNDFSDCPSCTLRHMASIGTTTETVDNACAATFRLMLLQQNPEMSLVMRQSGGIGGCQDSSTVSAVDLGLPVHVVFTSERWDFNVISDDFTTIRWYINGIALSAVDHINDSPWSAKEGIYLQILNNAFASRFNADFASSRGSILLLAVYNRTLNESEVFQNFEAGLANTPPVAEDITIVINEDGATQEEYQDPWIYLRDPMVAAVDLPIIILSVTDMDQELGFPGFDAAQEPELPEVFVDTLPSRGTLFDFNGMIISDVPRQVQYYGDYSVRYRPDKDGFSGLNRTYTSFTYTAKDGVTGNWSAVAGLVEIYVLQKNDPPVPVNMSATVLAGEANTLFLDGLDVDSSDGDFIVGAFLHDSPTYGVLYQVSDSETSPSTEVKVGKRIYGQLFSYIYEGNSSQVIGASSGEFFVQDSFTFRLFDSFDAVSILGHVSLSVISGMTAVTAQSQNDSSWICLEDTENRINVYVENAGSVGGKVVVVISTVPKHGSLLRVSDNSSLEAGDALSTNCTIYHLCVSSMKYLPMRDFFTSPAEKWNGDAVSEDPQIEQFGFYAVVSETGEYSNVAIQDIQVSNSNDPSDIQCPARAQVQPLGTNLYSGGIWSPLDRVTVDGISIVDPDNGLDVVKVKVYTAFGLVTLNPDHVSTLHFNAHTFCYEGGALQCRGSGTSERELIFVADPSNAENALNGMIYQSVVSNVDDRITITVLDGANGECLSVDLLSPRSVHQTCWQVWCSINVTVAGHYVSLGRVSTDDLSPQVLIIAGVGLVTMVCCVSLLCIQRTYWRKKQSNRV